MYVEHPTSYQVHLIQVPIAKHCLRSFMKQICYLIIIGSKPLECIVPIMPFQKGGFFFRSPIKNPLFEISVEGTQVTPLYTFGMTWNLNCKPDLLTDPTKQAQMS